MLLWMVSTSTLPGQRSRGPIVRDDRKREKMSLLSHKKSDNSFTLVFNQNKTWVQQKYTFVTQLF